MNLIAGLGNPGSKYVNTRHNIGFRVIENLAKRHDSVIKKKLFSRSRESAFTYSRKKTLLVQPLSFMNLSGEVVSAYIRRHAISGRDILVVCDDVNLPLGMLRLRAKGSAGGHNGLASVIEAIGTQDFSRLRIGIGGEGMPSGDISDYVLSDFKDNELSCVEEAIARSVTACEYWLKNGIEKAMSAYNS